MLFYFISHTAIGFFGGAAYLMMQADVVDKPLWHSSDLGKAFLGITSALGSIGMVGAAIITFGKYGFGWGLATIGEVVLGVILVRLVPIEIKVISSIVAPVILVVILGALFGFWYI